VAVEYGICLARRLSAQLTGLHVIDARFLPALVGADIPVSIGLLSCQQEMPAMLEAGLVEKADSLLEVFSQRCKKAGVPSEAKKMVGMVAETIVQEGQEAQLIVLAQRGERFHLPGGAVLGSTAESVARKAGRPVMVTPGRFMEIESMALAYDGSMPAERALSLAVDLSHNASWPLTTIIVTRDYQRAAELTKKLEDFIEALKIEKEIIINNETIILTGDADKELLGFIRQGAVELLVMGAYGHHRLKKMLFGSTTSDVIRKTTIPVLLTC
jgi:nucleotide-binding universal stress UspA family protein